MIYPDFLMMTMLACGLLLVIDVHAFRSNATSQSSVSELDRLRDNELSLSSHKRYDDQDLGPSNTSYISLHNQDQKKLLNSQPQARNQGRNKSVLKFTSLQRNNLSVIVYARSKIVNNGFALSRRAFRVRPYLDFDFSHHAEYHVSCRESCRRFTLPSIRHFWVRLLKRGSLLFGMCICRSADPRKRLNTSVPEQAREKGKCVKCKKATWLHCCILAFFKKAMVCGGGGQSDFALNSIRFKSLLFCRFLKVIRTNNTNSSSKIKDGLQNASHGSVKIKASDSIFAKRHQVVAMRQSVSGRRRRRDSTNEMKESLLDHGAEDDLLRDAVLDMERLERQRKIGNKNLFKDNYEHGDGLKSNGGRRVISHTNKEWRNSKLKQNHKEKEKAVKNNDDHRHYKQHYDRTSYIGHVENGRREHFADLTGKTNTQAVQKQIDNERESLYQEYLKAYEKLKSQEKKDRKNKDKNDYFQYSSRKSDMNKTAVGKGMHLKPSPKLGTVKSRAGMGVQTNSNSWRRHPHYLRGNMRGRKRPDGRYDMFGDNLHGENQAGGSEGNGGNKDERLVDDQSISSVHDSKHDVMGIPRNEGQGLGIERELTEHKHSGSDKNATDVKEDQHDTNNRTNSDDGVVDIVDQGTDTITLNVTGSSWGSVIHGHRDVIIAGCVVIGIGLMVVGCAITTRLVRLLKSEGGGGGNQSNKSKSYRKLGSKEELLNLRDSNFSLFVESSTDEEEEEEEEDITKPP